VAKVERYYQRAQIFFNLKTKFMRLLLRYRLHEKHNTEELIEMLKTEKNKKKIDEIAHAINLHLIDKKK